MIKADGSVLVHSDGGSYKPLNWMSPPCRLAEEPGRWVVTGKSGETLTIAVEEIKAFVHRHHGAGLAEVTEATALLFSTDDHRIARDSFLRGEPKRFTGR